MDTDKHYAYLSQFQHALTHSKRLPNDKDEPLFKIVTTESKR